MTSSGSVEENFVFWSSDKRNYVKDIPGKSWRYKEFSFFFSNKN